MQKTIYSFAVLLGLAASIVRGQDIPQPPPTAADKVIDKFLSASIDLARQRLSGPSFQYTPGLGDLRNHPGDVLIMNIAIVYDNQRLIDQIINYYENKNNTSGIPVPPKSATLLASAASDPGLVSTQDKARFVSHLSLLYGVQLIGKGGKNTDRFGTVTSRMAYIEPIGYVLYNHYLPGQKGRLYGGPGIYMACGLWGSSKYKGNGFDESYPAFDKDEGFQRFDAGLAATAGYQLPQGFALRLSYTLGLINIDPNRGDDKTKNRVLSLSIDYPLRKLADGLRKK